VRRALPGLALAALLLAACGTPVPEGPKVDSPTISGTSTDPRNRARVRTELASLYLQRGNMNVALEELRLAVEADPSYATAHGVFGLAYMGLKENQLAQASFERALGLAPEDPDINHNYGAFLCQTGREAASLAYFQRALANPLYPMPARSHTAAGACALRLGDQKTAEAHLQRALALEPNRPAALLELAQLRYRQGNYLEARKLLARQAKLAEPSAESLWLGLRIERRLGQRTDELSYANQLRRRFPASREAQALQRGQYD
jgi:type IV pilus assembly protein PilF